MSALWGEMKVTARTPHAGKQSINSAISQDAVSGSIAIDWCLLCVWACHFDSLHQYTTRTKGTRRVIERRGGMQGGERKSKQARGGRRLNWWPAENKEIVTQCTSKVTALHFQGKTICV